VAFFALCSITDIGYKDRVLTSQLRTTRLIPSVFGTVTKVQRGSGRRITHYSVDNSLRSTTMRSKIATMLLVIALVTIGAWIAKGQTDQVKKVSYEYQVLADPTTLQVSDEGLKQLNRLGSQGWELAGVVQQGNAAPLLYFKRVRRW